MGNPSRSFRDVVVWQKAHAAVLDVYALTRGFPKEELFGLTSQFRRAAVSIAANIAEGFKKAGRPDKLRFYNIAQGSIEECRYYVILSRDLRYADVTAIEMKFDEVGRLLEAYMAAIKRSR